MTDAEFADYLRARGGSRRADGVPVVDCRHLDESHNVALTLHVVCADGREYDDRICTWCASKWNARRLDAAGTT